MSGPENKKETALLFVMLFQGVTSASSTVIAPTLLGIRMNSFEGRCTSLWAYFSNTPVVCIVLNFTDFFYLFVCLMAWFLRQDFTLWSQGSGLELTGFRVPSLLASGLPWLQPLCLANFIKCLCFSFLIHKERFNYNTPPRCYWSDLVHEKFAAQFLDHSNGLLSDSFITLQSLEDTELYTTPTVHF